ncbi:MAG TPA: sulfite exporter TauE/SafE family protein [Candidatus Saccharimonadales bacterium]|nr:sulfite exporter TauE/SafE family protein [Candidatus Saccharimonadales bacterium]
MEYILTFIVVLLSSALSGMSGGGGGFIMTPYFLLIGLSPQQNIAVGSVIGLGLSGGSLFAARGKELVRRKAMLPLLILAALATITATVVLPKVYADVSHTFIGWFVLLMIPTLFINKKGFAPGERSQKAMILGYILYAFLWFANGLFSAGFAALLFIPMLFCMGLTAVEANIAKRYGALAQAIILFVILAPQGLILWNLAFASLAGAWIGGHFGTHIAIKNGERFARIALAVVMSISGSLLLLK